MVDNTNRNKETTTPIDYEEEDNALPTKKEMEVATTLKPHSNASPLVKNIPSEEEHKKKIEEKNNNTPPKKQQQQHTIIRQSLTREEYKKAGIPTPYNMEEDRKETFERQTKGNWTRKVTAITYIRDLDEQEFLDWNEERTGHTDMKRKITEPFNHMGQYEIPIRSERIEYDPDNEENRLVVEDRPKEIQKAYHCKFSKAALQELLDDCNPRTCQFAVSQVGQRAYSVSKKELEKYAGDFETIYSLKSDPNFKIVSAGDKK